MPINILYSIQNHQKDDPNFVSKNLENLCASIQYSIVVILLEKLEKAIKDTGIKEIAIAGGVSANSYFRSALKKLSDEKKYNLYIPKFEYCTDNAAMIAIAGYFKYLNNDFANNADTAKASLAF